jgi:hypothetical protein
MKVQEALKAAVNFIESVHSGEWSGGNYSRNEILTIIESALSDIEKCEPVAWMAEDGRVVNVHQKSIMHIIASDNHNIPLYTSPISKEWVGLSYEDVESLYDGGSWHEFATAIEAKLKQLNAAEKG